MYSTVRRHSEMTVIDQYVSLFLPILGYRYTVDSRYLEFDGTMEKIRVNRSSTQEELRRYRKCGLFKVYYH